MVLLILAAMIVVCPIAQAQLPPTGAPSSWGQVPQGTGACSVGKTCADLAPGMIRSALGPSPLDENVRALEEILSSRPASALAGPRAADWVVQAFRQAGADQVHEVAFGPAGQSKNVIAEIRGRDYPNDYVLIAAPLNPSRDDSVATSQNAAVLIDAVRVIHATGNLPRRSIRLVLFATGAEATGSAGGHTAGVWAYIRQHRAEIDRIAAAVVVDAASGPANGYSLGNRPDTLANVRKALEPLRSLGVRDFTEDLKISSEVTPFWLEGVPTLVAMSQGAGDHAEARSRADVVPEGVSPAKLEQLKHGVAIAAVTAYALADAESRIGPRQSRAEVRRSIQSMGLETRLKSTGLWDAWRDSRK